MKVLQDVKRGFGLAPISLNSAAGTALAIDAIGFNYLVVNVWLGVVGGAATVAKLTESDDNSTYRDITATYAGTTTVSTGSTGNGKLPQTADAGTLFRSHFVNLGGLRQRYFKYEITTGATTLVAVTYELYQGIQTPNSAAELGAVTYIVI